MRARLKRLVAVLICGAFVGVALAGCSKPENVTGGKGLSTEERKDKKGDN